MKQVPEVLTKPFNAESVEAPLYDMWEKSGYFNPDNLPGERTTPYTIIMPPPNANGSLHAGHARFATVQDVLIRFNRMNGIFRFTASSTIEPVEGPKRSSSRISRNF